MQPKVKLTPRKIGVQGPSMRRKEPTKMSQFSREELSELKRLSAMLPPRAAKEQDPAQLVLNAANYIQQLVATVRARVNKGTLPIGTELTLNVNRITNVPHTGLTQAMDMESGIKVFLVSKYVPILCTIYASGWDRTDLLIAQCEAPVCILSKAVRVTRSSFTIDDV
ncbi:unnamed protein product [Angiostrongylus costaricensis]|uniref:BHLH domain-containing protein n=1 Tax=Angiostrongylus costaricensis TaxID=334426 RepID=A0A0R3PNT8_ANGCS|nr:unnamed protein product [Angiostrongylus costaricensis]